MASVIFTHVRNIDMNILLQLDDESLHSVCQVDKYTQSLCNDNVFWHLKINKAYPELPIPKEYNQKLRELYQKITKEAITEWLAENNIYPDQNGTNYAAMQGHLEVLKWLAQAKKYLSRSKGC